MNKYLLMTGLLVAALAQSGTAEANGRRCVRQFLNADHYIIRCYDVPQQQQQSNWSVDQMNRVHFNCTTVTTQFGPRRYCY